MATLHPDPTTGPVRFVRGVLVGTGGASVSLLAHVAGGGEVPAEGPTTTAAMLGAVGLCWWLSDRRWTPTRLVGALLVVQSALHLLLAGTAAHGATLLMVLAHVGATALTTRLLLTGESWVWDLLDTLCLRVASQLRPAGTAPSGGRLVTRLAGAAAPGNQPLLLQWRRGPPAPLAAP